MILSSILDVTFSCDVTISKKTSTVNVHCRRHYAPRVTSLYPLSIQWRHRKKSLNPHLSPVYSPQPLTLLPTLTQVRFPINRQWDVSFSSNIWPRGAVHHVPTATLSHPVLVGYRKKLSEEPGGWCEIDRLHFISIFFLFFKAKMWVWFWWSEIIIPRRD